jgi:SSS family solute:Na+ symporter
MSHNANLYQLLIVGLFLTMTIAVGHLLRRHAANSTQFLHARRTLPAAMTAAAFLAANCGALEVVGLVAGTAKYGMFALHFYWLGSTPPMVFLALFILPIYFQSRAMTVPEFLRLRYNRQTQVLNAVSMSVMMACIAGISLYAISTTFQLFLGWAFFPTVLLGAAIVFCYVSLGGLKATIYNEVLQLAITVAGLTPLAYMVIRQFHGIRGLMAQLPPNMTHIWQGMPLTDPNSTMNVLGLVFGLGFVVSFGYWTTDFIVIQRALAAKTTQAAINTPLIAATVKLFFPLLVVVPGLAAAVFLRRHTLASNDQTLPWLMLRYYGPAMLGLGVAAIVASLMSSLSGNVNALSTILTHDFYKTYLRPNRDEAHYILVGRLAVLGATLLSIGTAYIAFRFNSLIDYLQLVLSLFTAPLFATFMLGMFTTWATPSAGFWGLTCGMLAALAHSVAYRSHLLHYGSAMLSNFYDGAVGWLVCVAVTVVVSCFTQPKPLAELQGVTYQTREKSGQPIPKSSLLFAGLLLVACVTLNIIFW